MSRAALVLLVLLGLVGTAALGYVQGRSDGVAAEAARRDGADAAALREASAEAARMVADARAASAAWRRAMAAAAAQNERTTKEFADVLAQTETLRAGCVLPADGLRQLAAARDRAAAATTGGVDAELPAAAADSGR